MNALKLLVATEMAKEREIESGGKKESAGWRWEENKRGKDGERGMGAVVQLCARNGVSARRAKLNEMKYCCLCLHELPR